MKALVTYQSKTGFTKKYAEWIAESLGADIKEVSKVHDSEVAEYGLVIHGGWIMGGMVNGLEKVKRMNPRRLIVFGVGFTAKEEVELPKYVEANKLDGIPFYCYEGGLNPKKMGLLGRTMVKMVTKKTPEYADNTDREAIAELLKKADEILRA